MKVFAVLIALNLCLIAETTKSWQSLPSSTIGVLEVDLSDGLLLELRKETKLGKSILAKVRLDKFAEILKKHSLVNPKLAAILAELRSSGFTIDEMAQILNSKFGLALVPKINNNRLYWSIIAWADLKNSLASKIINGLKERKQGSPVSYNGVDGLSFKNDWETSYSILAHHENTLLLMSSDIDSNHRYAATQSDSEEVFHSKEVCLDLSKEFISLLLTNGADSFTSSFKERSFYNKYKQDGRRLIEYHLDINRFLKLVSKNNNHIELAGFNDLKSLSGLVIYKNNTLSSTAFFETAEKRSSLLKLIDQPEVDLDPEPWVDDDVYSYTHFSLDALMVYEQIREMSVKQFGEAAVNQRLKAINTRSRAFLGADIKSILAGFGRKITFVDYGVQLNAELHNLFTAVNCALVVPFNNEAVSNRVIEIMTPFVEEKGIRRQDQKGFKGFSVESDGFSGSFYISKTKIVLASGSAVTSKVLSSLTSPPENSLSQNESFINFKKSIKQSESSMLTYGNLKKSVSLFYDLTMKVIQKKNAFAGMETRDKAFLQELLSNLPNKSELQEVIGAGGAYTKPVKDGLLIKGLIQLP